MGRVLGVDHGDRRVGLALSDTSWTFARPLAVVACSRTLVADLKAVAAQHEVDLIVLGFPRNMDGSLGPKARQMQAFKDRLEKESGLPVELWDERLTSVEAEQILRGAGLRPSARARAIDKVAAQVILQSFLDARARRVADDAPEPEGAPDADDGEEAGEPFDAEEEAGDPEDPEEGEPPADPRDAGPGPGPAGG